MWKIIFNHFLITFKVVLHFIASIYSNENNEVSLILLIIN